MSANKLKAKKNVLVAAYDAGGAEVIVAYMKKHSDIMSFHCYAGGPAFRVFRRERIPVKAVKDEAGEISRIAEKHRHADLALLGTGVMSRIEARMLAAVKVRGIKTAVYLESWMNYRERFGYPKKGWQDNLPDEIWVGDTYALDLAKRKFQRGTKVRFVKNEYFGEIVKRYKNAALSHPPGKAILFLSLGLTPGVQEMLEELLHYIAKVKQGMTVRIRFHPADARDRYDELISRYQMSVRIEKSREKDIVNDLLRAKVVVGAETVAMVAAVLTKKKTISIACPGLKSSLPFPQIYRTKRAKDAVKLI